MKKRIRMGASCVGNITEEEIRKASLPRVHRGIHQTYKAIDEELKFAKDEKGEIIVMVIPKDVILGLVSRIEEGLKATTMQTTEAPTPLTKDPRENEE